MPAPTPPRGPQKLPGRVRAACRLRHHSLHTEQRYVHWIRRYVHYHGLRHPVEMGAAEVSAFPSHLAVDRQVSASTQNVALGALRFLYRHVLGRDVGILEGVVRARRGKGVARRAGVPPRVPTRLSTATFISRQSPSRRRGRT